MTFLDSIDFNSSELADLYDELPLWSAPFGLWILEKAPLGSELTIVDLGAGTGFLSVELAERCGQSTTVFAIDPWESAMMRLERKVKQRNLSNIQLLVQDAQGIQLPDHSVDLIVSNLGVNNFENPHAVMDTCSRMAKPGATFLLTTNLVGHMAEFYNVYHNVLLQTGQSERIAVLEKHINHRATVDSVRRLLENAAFKIVEVALESFRLRFADGSALLRHYFIRLGFLAAWKEIPVRDMVIPTFAALEKELNAVAAQQGEISLTIPMAGFIAKRSL